MRIVPKALYGRPLVALSDNTRVARPVLVERMEYKPRPDEFFIIDRRTGKKVLVKRKNETVSADRRSTYLRLLDLTRAKQVYRLYEEDKKLEEGMKNLLGFLTFVSPSTYIGPVFNDNSKSYAENVMSGEGTGDVAGNVAIDILTPFAIGGINKGVRIGNRFYKMRLLSKAIDNSSPKLKLIPLNIGWGPKQTIPVSHASNTGNMLLFFPKRWDVINEGANPHGIWFQGKLGVPRTDLTNPGKGAKAAKARALFANRPVQVQGNVTLEKPMITIGDVPNRSWLSYYADDAGADGLIYSGIYDNGYNNNLVILSFKKMNQPKLTPIDHSKSPVLLDLDFRYPLTEGDNKVLKAFASLIMRGKMPGTSGMRVTPLETVNPEVPRIMNSLVFSRLGEIPPENLYSDIYLGSRSLMQNYHSRIQGVNFPGERIVIKEGVYLPYVLPHELRHRIDNTTPLSSALQLVLNKAYSDDFNSDEIKKVLDYDSSYDMLKEAVTTNLDSRIFLLEQYDPKFNLPVKSLNELIDRLSDESIIDAVSNSNGYGLAYIDYLKRNNLLTKDKVKAFRDAMKYVGGVSIPVTIGTSTLR